jgi:phosphotriesterase-related protein
LTAEGGLKKESSFPARISRRDAIRVLSKGAGLTFVASLGDKAVQAQSPGWLNTKSSDVVAFPKSAIIRTFLKDVPPESLASGATMIHEHISLLYRPGIPGLVAGQGTSQSVQPGEISVALMVDELRQAAKDGLRGIVDGNATNGPRTEKQLDFVKRVAMRDPEVCIVMAGGPFHAPFLSDVAKKSANQIADDLLQQATAQRWVAFGEVGPDADPMQPDERKALTAIARTHVRTGLPIFTHTNHMGCSKCALDQLNLFESEGVDLKHLVIGHLSDIRPISEPLGQTAKTIVQRGAFVGFDTIGEHPGIRMTDAMKVKDVLGLLEAGFEDQIVFSSDFSPTNAQNPMFKSNWGGGYSTVLTQFTPKLKYAGVKDTTLHKILVDNPRRFLAFVPKKTM